MTEKAMNWLWTIYDWLSSLLQPNKNNNNNDNNNDKNSCICGSAIKKLKVNYQPGFHMQRRQC